MPKIKLTQTSIEDIDPPPFKVGKDGKQIPTQVIYMDTMNKGLGVRVTSAGKKSFIAEKWVDGKPVRVTLGDAAQITVAKAWKEAQKVFGKLAEGVNPHEERRIEQAKAVTLGEVLDDFLLARKTLSPRTVYDYKRLVNNYLGDWKERPVNSITKDMIEKRHRALGEASQAQANYTMRTLRALINFAIEKYEVNGEPIMAVNPVTRLSRAKAWYEDKRRKTYVAPDQLKAWFDAVLAEPEQGRDYMKDARDYLQLVILTGMRRNEALTLKWVDVNLASKQFTIRDPKNHEDLTLPMSDYIAGIFERRHKASRSGKAKAAEFVFPGSGKSGHLDEPKRAVAKVVADSGVPFTLHDLRRTFITVAESLDISAYAVKRLVNHKMTNDVTAGYIVTDVERLRKPMQQITDFILSRAGVRKGTDVADMAEARAKKAGKRKSA